MYANQADTALIGCLSCKGFFCASEKKAIIRVILQLKLYFPIVKAFVN